MINGSAQFTRGYVQVYTGCGKGKTTAALGLAFRAMGHGLKTYIGQFVKGQKTGELEAARMVSQYITIEQYGSGNFIYPLSGDEPRDSYYAQQGLANARAAIISGKYTVVILDEIVTACVLRLITVSDILGLIACKPERLELVLTGSFAPPELIAAADLVSNINEVKHYFRKGVMAREGIEC